MSLLAALNLPKRVPEAAGSPKHEGADADVDRWRKDHVAKMKRAVAAAAAITDPEARRAYATTLATADRKRVAAERSSEPKARAEHWKAASDLLDSALASPSAKAHRGAGASLASDAPANRADAGLGEAAARASSAPVDTQALDDAPPAHTTAKDKDQDKNKDQDKSAVAKTDDGISTKFTFDLSPKPREGKLGRYVNGKVGIKLEGSAEISALEADNKVKAGLVDSKDGTGFKGEIDFIKNKLETTLMGLRFTEWKTTVGFELSSKKLDINVGVTFKIETAISWLSAIVTVKFKFVEADWKKLAGDKEPTIAAIELSGGSQFEGTLKPEDLGSTGSYKLKLTAKCTVAGQVTPDWAEVFSDVSKEVYEAGMKKAAEEAAKKAAEQAAKKAAEQAAKKAAEQAAKKAAEQAAKAAAEETVKRVAATAGEALVMDGAALASAAAAIMLPAAAALAIGAGMIQEARNMRADAEAIATGLSTRDRVAKAASTYAKVMFGGSGSGEGAQEAEAQIADMMRKTNATREQAIEAIKKAHGSQADLRARETKRLKDKLYAAACQAFDDAHKGDFGFLENRGETWGFRGSFRKMLSIILYGGD